MALAPGDSLAHYRITAKLGEGGVGEVYRATDSKLERQVAIKVLPEKFLEDEERRLRFEREARTLASLNHPGIVAIHSFEEISGRHLLVMELVEGEGLDARVASPESSRSCTGAGAIRASRAGSSSLRATTRSGRRRSTRGPDG